MKRIVVFAFLITFFVSCKRDNKVSQDIAGIEMNIKVERFDKLFAEASPEDLQNLKQAYPFLFPKQYDDSFWVAKMKDTLQRELFDEALKQFPDFETEEAEIELLFKHLKFYFPEFTAPRVITNTTSVDYRNKTIVTDTIDIIAIDTYFGSDHHFYEGIQSYLVQNFNREQIVVDFAENYAKKYIYQKPNRTLLDEMIYYGKVLYFKDRVVPFKTEAERIGYTQEQLDWAEINESEIWRYFIERELLFSTDSKLPSRFINPAPFSKFYLEEVDNESPGMIGRYIGWQIVRAYMNNTSTNFNQMLITSPEDIFNNSKFKPRK